jgi:hypothetical protein
MLVDPVLYAKSALLCAFSDQHSSTKRDTIQSLSSSDEILDFCRGLGLYVIADQINALEEEDRDTDKIPNTEKRSLSSLLVNREYHDHMRLGKLLNGDVYGEKANRRSKDATHGWDVDSEPAPPALCAVITVLSCRTR